MIEASAPSDWRDLQERAALLLRECGMSAETDRHVEMARGGADLDVYAIDADATPPTSIAVECKLWRQPVPQTVVHAFRTVVADVGANLGIVVSASGFQSGAQRASEFTNLKLLDWAGFESMFEDRWYERYMAPTLRDAVDPLIEYTEPINTRIFRKADALSEAGQQRFRDLRDKHMLFAFALIPSVIPIFAMPVVKPLLPLRDTLDGTPAAAQLPDAVLDATAYRPLLDNLLAGYGTAIGDFDELFGERA